MTDNKIKFRREMHSNILSKSARGIVAAAFTGMAGPVITRLATRIGMSSIGGPVTLVGSIFVSEVVCCLVKSKYNDYVNDNVDSGE